MIDGERMKIKTVKKMNNIVPILWLLFVWCVPVVMAQTEQTRLFEYDAGETLDIRENAVENRPGVKIYDISYASPKGGRVTAYLVVPAEKGKFGGAIFLHGSGANRGQFLPEALRLAPRGIVSLIIDAPSARPEPWRKSPYTYLEADRDIRVQSVIDLRRAVDLLTARRDVDAKRIAFVGYSLGATVGGVLAGVEKRIKAYVLMTAAGSQIEFWREPNNPVVEDFKKRLTPERFELYVKSLEPVEQINYINQAAPAKLFFQFAKEDEIIPVESAKKFYEAASKPKTVKWYKTKHSLNAQATTDRMNWVIEQVGSPLLREFSEPN